jgi:hypothetical protein
VLKGLQPQRKPSHEGSAVASQGKGGDEQRAHEDRSHGDQEDDAIADRLDAIGQRQAQHVALLLTSLLVAG